MKLVKYSATALWQILIGVSLCCSSLAGQDSLRLQFIDSFALEVKALYLDQLDQLYAVGPDNTLRKFTAQGQKQFFYSNNQLGELAHVDLTDPFNILLFYPEFQKIVILDRTLNPTTTFDLFSIGIVEAAAVATSRDNQIWIYDKGVYQLKKIDRQQQLTQQSQDLSLALATPPDGQQIRILQNFVYLFDPAGKLYTFDNFGQFSKQLFIPSQSVYVWNERLTFWQDKIRLELIGPELKIRTLVTLPREFARMNHLALGKRTLAAAREGWIYRYRVL